MQRTLVAKCQPSQVMQPVLATRVAASRRGDTRGGRRTVKRTGGRTIAAAVMYANARPSEEAAILSGYTDPATGLAYP